MCALYLASSLPAVVTVPPDREDFGGDVGQLWAIFVVVLLVLVQAPASGDLWFIAANLLHLVRVARRMPRMLNRALASRPSAVQPPQNPFASPG